jgi:hypothetical protein
VKRPQGHLVLTTAPGCLSGDWTVMPTGAQQKGNLEIYMNMFAFETAARTVLVN